MSGGNVLTVIWRTADFVSKPTGPRFNLRVTRGILPRLAAWRRARQRMGEMSLGMQRAVVILMSFLMAVWTLNTALSSRDWRPPLLALVGVGVLFVGATVLARVNRLGGQRRSRGLVAWLDGCPGWFGGVVFALFSLALGTGLYRFWGSLDEGYRLGRSGWAFEPLMVFTFGCLALLFLLQMRSQGPPGDER